MDFDFSDDQQALRDAVRKWVGKAYGFERRRSIVESGGFSRDAWRELADLGLAGLAIGPDHGGLGFGSVEAMVVMEELGRGLVLEPYAHAALVAPALLARAADDLRTAWLPKMATGDAIVVLAHQERGARYRLAHVATAATSTPDGWYLSGAKSIVPAGDAADAFIVPARVAGKADDEDGIGLFLVERGASGATTTGYAMQDGARAAELKLVRAPAALLVAPGPAFGAFELAVDAGIAALAAEAVGAMDKLFDLTVEYLNTRKQFGVPIGTFQALRHRIADCKMELELARSMSYYATLKLDEERAARRRSISQAKVQLGRSMRFLGQQCVQMHGGIGVTDEYAGSHYFKRLSCIEMTFGDTLHHLGEVSERMENTAGAFN